MKFGSSSPTAYDPVIIGIDQETLQSILATLRPASQTSGTLSQAGKLWIGVEKDSLILHVQSDLSSITVYRNVKDRPELVGRTGHMVIDFNKFYKIVMTHDPGDRFDLTMADPTNMKIESALGTWQLAATDIESYFPIIPNTKVANLGVLDRNRFNLMRSNIIKLPAIMDGVGSGAWIDHRDGLLSLYVLHDRQAGMIQDKLDTPLAQDFCLFVVGQRLRSLVLPEMCDTLNVYLDVEEDALIFDNRTEVSENEGDMYVTMTIPISSEEDARWDDIKANSESYSNPYGSNEGFIMERLALKAAFERLSLISPGLITLELLDNERMRLSTKSPSGDTGREVMTVSMIDDVDDPAPVILQVGLDLITTLLRLDTDDALEICYSVGEDDKSVYIAEYQGVLKKTNMTTKILFVVEE